MQHIAKSIGVYAFTRINVNDTPFLISRVCKGVGTPFAAMTMSALLGRLSKGFRRVFMGMFSCSHVGNCGFGRVPFTESQGQSPNP